MNQVHPAADQSLERPTSLDVWEKPRIFVSAPGNTFPAPPLRLVILSSLSVFLLKSSQGLTHLIFVEAVNKLPALKASAVLCPSFFPLLYSNFFYFFFFPFYCSPTGFKAKLLGQSGRGTSSFQRWELLLLFSSLRCFLDWPQGFLYFFQGFLECGVQDIGEKVIYSFSLLVFCLFSMVLKPVFPRQYFILVFHTQKNIPKAPGPPSTHKLPPFST